MDTPKSKIKVRLVGLLDGLLSVALLIQIICSTIYPLVVQEHNINNNKGGETSKYWILTFLGLVIFFGIVPILAAMALVMSTMNINDELALQMMKFWMHCNIFTIVLALIEFAVVLFMYLNDLWVGVPGLILLYLGIRAIFTCVIRDNAPITSDEPGNG